MITALVAAVAYLVTKKPSVIDQLVILTVPSGAEITLDGVSYGTSPVKLEKVKVGTYRLTISKDNYVTIDEEVTISDSTSLDYRLKEAMPADLASKSREEKLQEFRDRAEDYFARGRFANPGDESAIRYVAWIEAIDPGNEYARNKREEIRKALLQNAQAEMSRGQLGSAKEYYSQLREYFPDDEEARAGAVRLDALLLSKKGEIGDWIRRAEAAFRAGRLVEPQHSSAFYYAREALAIDGQNPQALAIHDRIKDKLLTIADQYRARGDDSAERRQLETINRYFPRDKQIHARLSELNSARPPEVTKTSEAQNRRREGLSNHRGARWAEAIEDLDFALENGVPETPDVLYALGDSHKSLGNYDRAMEYLSRIPSWVPGLNDTYNTARAIMGDIEARRGNTGRAIELYQEARDRGGSIRYGVDTLDDKIESLERQAREKAEAPKPITIQVKHPHTFGSCKGSLTVDGTGVFYRPTSGDDDFSFTLLGVDPILQKNKIELRVQGKSKTFEGDAVDLEKFRNALNKYKYAAK